MSVKTSSFNFTLNIYYIDLLFLFSLFYFLYYSFSFNHSSSPSISFLILIKYSSLPFFLSLLSESSNYIILYPLLSPFSTLLIRTSTRPTMSYSLSFSRKFYFSQFLSFNCATFCNVPSFSWSYFADGCCSPVPRVRFEFAPVRQEERPTVFSVLVW